MPFNPNVPLQHHQLVKPPSNQQQHQLPILPLNQQKYQLQHLPTPVQNQQYHLQQKQLLNPSPSQQQYSQIYTSPSNKLQYNQISTPPSNQYQHHQQQHKLPTPPSNQRQYNQKQHQIDTPPSNQQQQQFQTPPSNQLDIQETHFSTPVQVTNAQQQQYFEQNQDFMTRHFNSAPPSTANHNTNNTNDNMRVGAHLNQLELKNSMNNSDSSTTPRNYHRINRSLSFSEDLLSTLGTPSLMDPSSHVITTTQNISTSSIIPQEPVNSCKGNNTEQAKITVLNTSHGGGNVSGISFSRENASTSNMSRGENTSNLSVSRENTSGDGFPLPVNVLLNDLPMPETLPNLTFSPSKPLHETSFSEVKQFLKTPQKVKAMREEERKLKEAARSNSSCSSPLDAKKKTDVSIIRTPQKLKTLKEEAEEAIGAPLTFTSTPEKKTLQKNREGKILVSGPDDEVECDIGIKHDVTHSAPDSPMDQGSPSTMSLLQSSQSRAMAISQTTTVTTLGSSSFSTVSCSLTNNDNCTVLSDQMKLGSQIVSSTKHMVVSQNNSNPSVIPTTSDNSPITVSKQKRQQLPNIQATTIGAKPSAANISNSNRSTARMEIMEKAKQAVVVVDDVFMQDATVEPLKAKDLPTSAGSHLIFTIRQNQQVEPSVNRQPSPSTDSHQITSGIQASRQVITDQQHQPQENNCSQLNHPLALVHQTTPTKKNRNHSTDTNAPSPQSTNHTTAMMVTPTKNTYLPENNGDGSRIGALQLTKVMNRKDSIGSENSTPDDSNSAHPATPTSRNPQSTALYSSSSPQPLLTTKDYNTTNISCKDSNISLNNCPITQTSTGVNNRRTKQQQQQPSHQQPQQPKPETASFDYEQRLKERAADFANIYFNRVHKVLLDNEEDGGTELAIQFFTLMRSANQRSMSKLETYHQVATLLVDFPELVDSFVGFLDQHEARHVGKVSCRNTLWDKKIKLLFSYSR